jgi:5'-phosphate synthase pdxT subunit
MGKLLKEIGLYGPIKTLIDGGLPVLGTCAGMILLASAIENDSTVHFGTLPITVRRNAFGRQLGSFHTVGEFAGIPDIPMTFIRAPVITKADESVVVLATIGDRMVAARQGNILVTAFHPELTTDLTIHNYFLKQM